MNEVPTDQAELERLRLEVAQLQAQLESKDSAGEGFWRWLGTWVLIVLVFLLTPVSVAGAWAQSIVFDTDRYVETVAPLSDDPDVQAALAEQITAAILVEIDVPDVVDSLADSLVQQGAPDAVRLLTPFAVDGVETLISGVVDTVVTSDAFTQAWETANRTAHEGLVTALTGEGETVVIQGNEVRIQTAAFIDAVKVALSDTGLASVAERIPTVQASFVVFESESLSTVQRGMRALDQFGTWLPIITALLAVVAVAVAPNRRKAIIFTGSAVALSAVLLGIGLSVARAAVAESAASTNQAAVLAVYDQVLSFLRTTNRAVFVLALVAVLLAWLSGPSGPARAVRGGLEQGFGQLRGATVGAAEPGPFRAWLIKYRRPIQGTTIGLGVLALVFWPYPTATVVIVLVLLVGVLLALVQVFGVQAARADAGDLTTSA